MSRYSALVLYVVFMIALIVAVDVLLFRDRFWERLAANTGIVLICLALYPRFFRKA